jgi:hypothetical protein
MPSSQRRENALLGYLGEEICGLSYSQQMF